MSYSSIILGTAGLVGYWKLDEPSGTVAADGKGSNAGTYTGGVTLGQPGIVAGGTSARFDGVDDRIVFPGFVGLLATSYSYEAWISIPADGTATEGCIMSSGTMGILNRISVFSVKTNAMLTEWRWGIDHFWPVPELRDGAWHHAVFTWDGTTKRVYFDAALMTPTQSGVSPPLAFSGTGGQTPEISIGAQVGNNGYGPGGFFPSSGNGTNKTGRMAHAAYYNVALAPSDVTAHYNAGMTAPVVATTIYYAD